MERKYEFTDETKEVNGHTLHRIVAVRDFDDVRKGDKGGWIEKESNLSHYGGCWVFADANAYESAIVHGNAIVCGEASVCGNAKAFDNAAICDQAKACGIVVLHGDVELCGTAYVSSNADYIVFKNWWSSGRYFTWTRSNNKWKVGCFYGSGDELIQKAYADSYKSGREYDRIVRYVDEILKDNQE